MIFVAHPQRNIEDTGQSLTMWKITAINLSEKWKDALLEDMQKNNVFY